MIINTPGGKDTKKDEKIIRSTAVMRDIPLVTTMSGAEATVNGMESLLKREFKVKPLQEYY